MNAINAEVTKDKAGKQVTYSFEVNNRAFKARYSYGKKTALEITCDETPLGVIEATKTKFEYEVDSNAEKLRVAAWIDSGFSFASLIGKVKGVGVEVNGMPVRNTITDPKTHIGNGRYGLYVLLFLLGFKSIWYYYSAFKEYSSHITAGVASAVYFIPLLVASIAAAKYKTRTMFAIITGIVLATAELIDFAIGIPESAKSGSSSFVVWTIIRISVLYSLFGALKWKRKPRESRLAYSGSIEKHAEPVVVEKGKKSVFLMVCLPVIGLVISLLFVIAVGLTKKINEMLFFPQFMIFAALFLFVYPNVMVLISNLYFSKTGKKSWDGWFKMPVERQYDYVFTVIGIMPALFLMIELSVFCNVYELSDAFASFAISSFLIWLPVCGKMIKKLCGCANKKPRSGVFE